jgi:hypothetical protein
MRALGRGAGLPVCIVRGGNRSFVPDDTTKVEGDDMRARQGFAALCAVSFLAVAAAIVPSHAAAVPAWLDDGISKWNAANPGTEITFVNIKDSYVWYNMPKGDKIDQKKIRERVNSIVLGNGYKPLDDEEMVTTAKPPVTGGRAMAKKCWSRSFVLDIQAENNTKAVGDDPSGQRQRMLTSMVCDDNAQWWAAFRVAN